MKKPGTLYVVATPLGNLDDLSARAARILKEADLVACEDTRHTRKLLNHLAASTPAVSYHEHNEAERAAELLARLQAGNDIALVSDAGTPLIADPGYRLVSLCREQGVSVVPVPGPSAAVAALSVSGLPSDRFLFVGFLPRKAGSREGVLQNLAQVTATLVFYLSPHGLIPTLQAIQGNLGDRRAFLVREMTKAFETSHTGTVGEIVAEIAQDQPRGEYTLVVEGAREKAKGVGGVDADAYVHGLTAMRGLPRAAAIRQAARDLGLSRRELYARLLSSREPES
jgi:16S rRNA (cytidine1402-2'-O)-methyltransferase